MQLEPTSEAPGPATRVPLVAASDLQTWLRTRPLLRRRLSQALALEAGACLASWLTLLALGLDARLPGTLSAILVSGFILIQLTEVWPTLGWRLRQRVRHFLLLEGLALAGIITFALLMALAPRALGYSTFIVYGSSMEPAIPVGSVTVAKPTQPESLRVGDIVAFKPFGSVGLPTTHRIVGIQEVDGARAFKVQGDANRKPDPNLLVLDGTGSKVLYSVPYIGYLLDFTSQRMGNAAFILLPALLLTAILLLDVWVPKPQGAQGT